MKINFAPGFKDSWDRYAPLRWWKTLRCIPRKAKWKWQRMNRGWADCDVWSFDNHLSRVTRDGLRYLRDHHHGFPAACKTDKEWIEVLNKIIDGFDAAVRQQEDIDLERFADLEKRKQESLKLFIEHFDNFWD